MKAEKRTLKEENELKQNKALQRWLNKQPAEENFEDENDSEDEILDKIIERVNEGLKYIYPQKTSLWIKCVHLRSEGSLNGFEVDEALKMMKSIEIEHDYKKAFKIFMNPLHSEKSRAFTFSIVLNFSKSGVDFFKLLMKNTKLPLRDIRYLNKLEKENKQFEAELIELDIGLN